MPKPCHPTRTPSSYIFYGSALARLRVVEGESSRFNGFLDWGSARSPRRKTVETVLVPRFDSSTGLKPRC